MCKKFCVAIGFMIIALLIGGCTHFGSNTFTQNDLTSYGRRIDRAPAEFLLENFAPNINPANMLVFQDGDKTIDCNKLTSRTETFNGKEYKRFNVSQEGYLSCPQVKAMKTTRIWKVKKLAWDAADEAAYENFIKQMALSKCNTADKCLSGPGNILRAEEDMLNNFYTDCADLPYYLRAYFAYKMNLPFSIVFEIAQAPFTVDQIISVAKNRAYVINQAKETAAAKFDKANPPITDQTRDEYINAAATTADNKFGVQSGDLRYSLNGNIPVSRVNIPATVPRVRDFGIFAPQIVDTISSGTMRMTSAPEGGKVQPDFYSPSVRPGNIKAGTVLYNVSGHVAIVYDVTPMGEVLFMDAHPDNSISRGSFNLDYRVVRAAYGGNFKNFRPLRVINPQYDPIEKDVIISGQIIVDSDDKIPQYSLEQYNGDSVDSNTGKGIFKLEPNDTVPARDFQEWVKYRLSNGQYRLIPTNEMKNEVNALCAQVQNRAIAVQEGLDNGMPAQFHPQNLPQNIYGAEGSWEAYSSPGSDIRLRSKMLNIVEAAKGWIQRFNDKEKNKDRIISYTGPNLKSDLIAAYQAAANNCKISYKNSVGGMVNLTLDKVINRAALLSYDPYNCPELRWGASGAELSTCTDNADKKDWYRLQQFLRNATEKNTNAVHGYSLDQLRQMDDNKSVNNNDTSARYNILTGLQAL